MTLTVTDLFCGAGGSSIGAEDVPGCAKHWVLKRLDADALAGEVQQAMEVEA